MKRILLFLSLIWMSACSTSAEYTSKKFDVPEKQLSCEERWSELKKGLHYSEVNDLLGSISKLSQEEACTLAKNGGYKIYSKKGSFLFDKSCLLEKWTNYECP